MSRHDVSSIGNEIEISANGIILSSIPFTVWNIEMWKTMSYSSRAKRNNISDVWNVDSARPVCLCSLYDSSHTSISMCNQFELNPLYGEITNKRLRLCPCGFCLQIFIYSFCFAISVRLFLRFHWFRCCKCENQHAIDCFFFHLCSVFLYPLVHIHGLLSHSTLIHVQIFYSVWDIFRFHVHFVVTVALLMMFCTVAGYLDNLCGLYSFQFCSHTHSDREMERHFTCHIVWIEHKKKNEF